MKQLLVLFTFSPLFMFSQEVSDLPQQQKNRFSIHFAGSFPSSEFAETDTSNRGAGFADNGRLLAIGYQYQLNETFYLTSKFLLFNHAVNVGELIKAGGFNSNPDVSYTLSADDYRTSGITIGAKTAFGNEVIKGYANPFIGYAMMVQGETGTVLTGPMGSSTIVQRESDPAGAFIFGAELGVEVYLSEQFCLSVDFSAIRGEFGLEGELFTKNVNNETKVERYEGEQEFSTVNLGIGLGYYF